MLGLGLALWRCASAPLGECAAGGISYILRLVLLCLLVPKHHTAYSDHLGQGSRPC